MSDLPARIPKKVHYCWLSGEPLPALQRRCLESWRRHLPGFELVRWDCERFAVEEVPFVKEAVACRKWAFAADYLRLHALHEEGGIYLDSDVELFGSLEPFLHHRAFSGIEYWPEVPSIAIEGAILGAEKRHPWMAACLEHYRGRSFLDAEGRPDEQIVSSIIAAAAEGLGFRPVAKGQELAEGVKLYDPVVFTHATGEFSKERTVALHHCLGSWRDRAWHRQLWQHAKAWFRRG
ncbi:hypothetical protein HNR46_002998 [Haloferula luteola]|uniref:Uncharacterized protein n=1 Tax=Haloferula luteola TaxID=595692 RepID=A0A840VG01_9BACT|nr:glycosyltransferase [Haloferula luteola]MBB5352750.1 hypothetical protein [Haloferula luteola]